MPYTLKTNQISVKDPETGEYSGVDILAEQTEQGLIAELQAEGTTQVNRINQAAVDVQSAVDKAETDAAKIISDTQTSVNTLETQKNTIAQTVASMAELGTDTTLSTPGMAADAGAVGDLSRQINDVEDLLIEQLIDYAENVLEGTPVLRNGDNGEIDVNGATCVYSGSTFDADKWVAFPISDFLVSNESFSYKLTFSSDTDLSKISSVAIRKLISPTTTGYLIQEFDAIENVYSMQRTVVNTADLYVAVLLTRYATDFTFTLSMTKSDSTVKIKDGIIKRSNLDPTVASNIIPAINTSTNVFAGTDSGINTEESATTDYGKYNAGFGVRAMQANTTGDHSSAFGFQALMKNTTGEANTAIGEDAIYENINGNGNTAVGAHALQNVTDSQNTGVGSGVMLNLTSGYFNTGIGGYNNGLNLTTGVRNTLIGAGANVSDGGLNDCIVIGMSSANKSGQIKIGQTNSTEVVFRIGGNEYKLNFNQDGTVTWESPT